MYTHQHKNIIFLLVYHKHDDYVLLIQHYNVCLNNLIILILQKLEWESLSVDLLPHPDMFSDLRFTNSDKESSRDDDGAKRLFFGGERFLEGVSGQAYVPKSKHLFLLLLRITSSTMPQGMIFYFL